MDFLTISILAAGGFAATNIDNLFLLIGWMALGEKSRGQILLGYTLAALAVLTLSQVLGWWSGVLPVQYVGYLGVVPILMGATMLVSGIRDSATATHVQTAIRPGAVGVATALFSNSVDTILVISSLLADSQARLDYVILVTFLIMSSTFYALGRFLHSQIVRLEWVSAVARWVAPLLMIAVGAYILDNTMTDTLAGN